MINLTLLTVQNHFRLGTIGELTRIQTTFIEIILGQTAYRVDFRGKQEFSAKTGVFSSLDILNHHPLLLDHIEQKAFTLQTLPVIPKHCLPIYEQRLTRSSKGGVM